MFTVIFSQNYIDLYEDNFNEEKRKIRFCGTSTEPFKVGAILGAFSREQSLLTNFHWRVSAGELQIANVCHHMVEHSSSTISIYINVNLSFRKTFLNPYRATVIRSEFGFMPNQER